MKVDPIDEVRLHRLKQRKDELHSKLLDEHSRMQKAKEVFKAIKHDYEEVDREIAMLYKIVLPPAGTTQRKPKKPRDFTKEEIQQIADRLKVKIEFKT